QARRAGPSCRRSALPAPGARRVSAGGARRRRALRRVLVDERRQDERQAGGHRRGGPRAGDPRRGPRRALGPGPSLAGARVMRPIGLALALVAIAPAASARKNGIAGESGQGAATCNDCHSGGAAPKVQLTGPATLDAGATGTYRLLITGGAGVVGGL